MTSVRVVISGRVQGVGYRSWTVSTANKLKLKGWVRNLSDGTVEALFCGEDAAVSAMLEACKKGPLVARVDDITHFPGEQTVENGFFAKPTV